MRPSFPMSVISANVPQTFYWSLWVEIWRKDIKSPARHTKKEFRPGSPDNSEIDIGWRRNRVSFSGRPSCWIWSDFGGPSTLKLGLGELGKGLGWKTGCQTDCMLSLFSGRLASWRQVKRQTWEFFENQTAFFFLSVFHSWALGNGRENPRGRLAHVAFCFVCERLCNATSTNQQNMNLTFCVTGSNPGEVFLNIVHWAWFPKAPNPMSWILNCAHIFGVINSLANTFLHGSKNKALANENRKHLVAWNDYTVCEPKEPHTQ